ncbi:hypothetical protein LVJ94_21075 [Pendulispora rubella]|uniref:Flp pilus-assembly TadG-like N-terminal domain-containing protein n=1 Tax=Pendulispora rubella TaxID=2741070 RepID=A0ABZ2LFN8_9BACT
MTLPLNALNSSKSSNRPRLVRDENGAVMVMGLFMAISLIGSLWFIMGIGDAIIIRDKAIEAADHAAFSAAAVHARGMNFVAALNLIMFALAVIYVVLCIVADVLIAVGALGGFSYWGIIKSCLFNFSPAVLIPGVAGIANAVCNTGHSIAKVAEKYSDVLQKIFMGIGALEDVIQVGMPIAAEAASVNVVSKYKPYSGMMLSASLIPCVSKAETTMIGLPLTKMENSFLCEKAFNEVEAKINEFVPPPAAQFLSFVINLIQGYVVNTPSEDTMIGIGCGDWDDTNVHVVSDGAGNGTDVMQMWGLVIGGTKDEEKGRAERRVSMSKNKGHSTEQELPKQKIYYSQAEYYFDCTKDWTDKECFDDDLMNASFSMQWRARLRRVYAPSFGNQAIGLLSSFALSGGNPMDFMAAKMSENPAAQKMADSIDKVRNGALSGPMTGTGFGQGADSAMNFLTGGDKPIH